MAPEIWTAKDIAEWLGFTPRYVVDKLSKEGDFPKPVVGGRGVKARWLKDVIIRWADRDGLLDRQ